MYKSLVEWFRILNIKAPHSNAEDLSDGVAMAQALNQFAPELFTEIWLSKIKSDVASNWRLKMSNLKKVIEGLYDYYSEVLNCPLSDFPRPDAMLIAEKSDIMQLERLLQLILGCAVNCNDKQEYIKQIMNLEESLQQNIMKALQELESTWQGNSLSYKPVSNINLDVKTLQEEKDAFAEKYFQAEKKIRLLVEEKLSIQQELLKLQRDSEAIENPGLDDDGVSLGPIRIGSVRYNDLRNQLDRLKEELMQSETSREDLKIKVQQQEKDMNVMQQRIDELTQCTVDFAQLKDEIDILRESNDKLKNCESQLVMYKKKLEDYNALKRHVKLLEEKSADYILQSNHYEEVVKKCATLKGQVDLFKKEIQDLHIKLDEEVNKNLKLLFENKNLESNIRELQRNKDALCKDRESLKEAIDELKCGLLTSAKGYSGNTVSSELQPIVLVEKLQRLESENKALREGKGGQEALMQLLDDANKRNDTLCEQLKYANDRVVCLTNVSRSDDQILQGNEFGKQLRRLMELNDQKVLQLEESTTQNSNLHNKITQLETMLSIREQELLSCESKHRKCMEKAKEIIKNLDPRIANVLEKNGIEKNEELEECLA